MNLMRRLKVCALVLVLASGLTGATPSAPTRPFDVFGDIKCEDEMARLDNFAIHLLHEPSAKGVIVFYGGRRFRGRLPKRGEAAARAARLKPYLVQRRGVPTDQVIVIDGGYAEEWEAILWVVPAGASVTPDPRIPITEIKFRRGKAHPRDFRCQV